jgi:chorismate mutase
MAGTIRAIRGAIQVDADDSAQISEATKELVAAVLNRNGLDTDEIISMLFTMTPDLRSEFPALGARQVGLHDVPVMCATEIAVPHGMARVIRVMAHIESTLSRSEIQHVYLRGATALRPDLVLPSR